MGNPTIIKASTIYPKGIKAIEIKTKVDSGSIIYIKDATYLDCLVEYIKSKDLKISAPNTKLPLNKGNT